MGASYELTLTNPVGVPLLTLDKFVRCSYARTINGIGEMQLVVPAALYPFELFQPDGRVYVQRSIGDIPPYLDMGTAWLIRSLHDNLEQDGQTVHVFDLQDTICLLDTRIVAYNSGNSYTLKLGAADDLMKAFMRENMGTLATDTDRDLTSYLTIEPDTTLGAVIRWEASRRRILEVLQELAQASYQNTLDPTYLAFDIVVTDQRTGTLEFRTYADWRGNDHRFPGGSPPLVLDPDLGNLADVQLGYLYQDERTYVYAGGQGVGDIRAILPAYDNERIARSPWNRREEFVDVSTTDLDALQAAADAALRDGRPDNTFTGRLIENDQTLRGVHWDYGDFLTANYRNQAFDVRVEKVGVVLQNADSGIAEESQVLLSSEP